MKNSFLNTLFIFATILIFSQAIFGQNQTTVLFVDKSGSATLLDDITIKYEKSLSTLLNSRIKKSGDLLVIAYIYGHTQLPSNRQYFAYKPPQLEIEGLNRLEEKKATLIYRKKLKAYNQSYFKKVTKAVFGFDHDQAYSEVFASLKWLHDYLGNSEDVEVTYFSDMLEHSSHKVLGNSEGHLVNVTHAKQEAAEDAERILEYFQMDKSRFSQIKKVTIVLPTSPLEQDPALRYIGNYWGVLFKEMGISNMTIN